jgi:hypothetical protein
MYFSRTYTVWAVALVLMFGVGLLIFIYFQGGVEWSVYLR